MMSSAKKKTVASFSSPAYSSGGVGFGSRPLPTPPSPPPPSGVAQLRYHQCGGLGGGRLGQRGGSVFIAELGYGYGGRWM
jgi:hypothetical protein